MEILNLLDLACVLVFLGSGAAMAYHGWKGNPSALRDSFKVFVVALVLAFALTPFTTCHNPFARDQTQQPD